MTYLNVYDLWCSLEQKGEHMIPTICVNTTRHSKFQWNTNQELSAWLVIGTPQSRSHIWTSSTFVEYLEHLAQEIRHKRRMHKLTLKDKCLCICDCATQHSMKHFQAIKEAWCKQHNTATCLKLQRSVVFFHLLLHIYYLYIYICIFFTHSKFHCCLRLLCIYIAFFIFFIYIMFHTCIYI